MRFCRVEVKLDVTVNSDDEGHYYWKWDLNR